jgi:FKBP-type peptidyl-prolyl cis-trans isomerase
VKRTLSVLLAALAAPFAMAGEDPPIPADTQIVATPSGLKYSLLSPGDGATYPKAGDVVAVHYTGWFADGKKFDSSRDRGEPLYFEVGRGKVIKGWDEALPLLSKGARAKLTVPSDLAYGPAGRPPRIPGNATLTFDVELLDVPWVFRPLDEKDRKTTPAGLLCQVVSPGAGAPPMQGDFVKFRYAAWKPNGELIEYSQAVQQKSRVPASQPISALLGDLRSPFLQEALLLTPRGGSMRFEVPASTCWPDRLPAGVKADTKITWQIDLVEAAALPAFSIPELSKLQKTASGLAYEVIRDGTGRKPTATDTVHVNYIGWLTDGTMFDASYRRGQPATFALTEVIKGWVEGLQLMKEGAIYKFVIPGELGYGAAGFPSADIPPHATLVFHLELVSID